MRPFIDRLTWLVLFLAAVFLLALLPKLAMAQTPPDGVSVRVDSMRTISVAAHVPVPDSIATDSAAVRVLARRAMGAIAVGLNEAGIPWRDAAAFVENQRSYFVPTARTTRLSRARYFHDGSRLPGNRLRLIRL